MILVTMRFRVYQDKRREFLQAMESHVERLRLLKGCQSCSFYQDFENDNYFCLVAEWTSREEFDDYIRSNDYAVLSGAVNILTVLAERKLDITQGGMEIVQMLRKK